MIVVLWIILLFAAFHYSNTITLLCIATSFRHWKSDFAPHDRLNDVVNFVDMVFYPNHRKTARVFWEPSVSLLVPTKNEEKIIQTLLDSILELDYPKEKLEVMIIDESDEDATPEIVKQYSKKHPHITLLNRFELPPRPKGYNSVSYGLTLGIERAKGEVIVVTEADCVLPPTYIHFMIAPLLDNAIGCVSSMYVINGPSVSAHLQRLDMAGLLWLGLASLDIAEPFIKKLKIKVPGICWGGSFSIRKSFFYQIGGWKGLETEHAHDLFLGWRVTEHGYKALYTYDHRTKVQNHYTTSPFKQRLRWYKAGTRYLNKSWQSYLASFNVVGLPFISCQISTFIIVACILGLYGIFPFAQLALMGIFDLGDLVLAIINIGIYLGSLYGMAIFSCISPNVYGGYKTKKAAVLTFPFWFMFQCVIFILSLFKRKIEWK
ncbi:MAG: glycosyltransferase [Candidatus Helarchaeota archaeon]